MHKIIAVTAVVSRVVAHPLQLSSVLTVKRHAIDYIFLCKPLGAITGVLDINSQLG